MSLSQDQRVREHYYKKDKDFNEKIKKEMEEEESQLNDYFKQYNKPVKEDPSIIRRDDGIDKLALLKEAFSPFQVFGRFYHGYWNKQCETPQEQYVLNLCKKYTKRQVVMGVAGGLCLTTLLSFTMRMSLRPSHHFFGLVVGVSSGTLYGIIKSTKYTMQRLESLGQGYDLGRDAVREVQKLRMDKIM